MRKVGEVQYKVRDFVENWTIVLHSPAPNFPPFDFINANRKERVLSLSEYQIAVSHKFYGSQPDARICCLPCERLNRGCFNLETQVSFL